MAFYVRMQKLDEDQATALYSYSGDQVDFGEAELDKGSGEVRVVRRASHDIGEHLFARAAAKLRREWRNGSVPDVAEWAS